MTEPQHPYRATPAPAALRARVGIQVGAALLVQGDETYYRFVDALPTGEGHLVTVLDLWWSFATPDEPFKLSALSRTPQPPRITTFYTMLSLAQIRSAFFEETP